MAQELEHRNAIRSDNIGHKLLSKMGWKEGQGVGAAGNGMTAPIQAGGMKGDNRGLGAQEVRPPPPPPPMLMLMPLPLPLPLPLPPPMLMLLS